MERYANKEIADFIVAANRDLGDEKYTGAEMIPDYCKAVNICKQLQNENKKLIEKVAQLQKQYDDAIIAQVEKNKKGDDGVYMFNESMKGK